MEDPEIEPGAGAVLCVRPARRPALPGHHETTVGQRRYSRTALLTRDVGVHVERLGGVDAAGIQDPSEHAEFLVSADVPVVPHHDDISISEGSDVRVDAGQVDGRAEGCPVLREPSDGFPQVTPDDRVVTVRERSELRGRHAGRLGHGNLELGDHSVRAAVEGQRVPVLAGLPGRDAGAVQAGLSRLTLPAGAAAAVPPALHRVGAIRYADKLGAEPLLADLTERAVPAEAVAAVGAALLPVAVGHAGPALLRPGTGRVRAS